LNLILDGISDNDLTFEIFYSIDGIDRRGFRS